MNTQTHLLVATALLVPTAQALLAHPARPGLPRTDHIGGFLVTMAVLFGATVPDASLFVMFFIAKSQGVADSVIWSEWYYSHTWQYIGAISNSIPMYSTIALLGLTLRRYPSSQAKAPTVLLEMSVIASLAALLHCITDLPLHHNDGHPHFWPFTDWIYSSPVSYWDPAHHGSTWQPIEISLAAVLIVFLWRRYTNLWTKSALVLIAFSYVAVAWFWVNAF